MSEACTGGAASGVAGWLSLAAAPTFAVMALLTHFGGAPMDALCSAGTSLHLGGMVPMYLLMSAFHSGPWLKLIGGRA
jgi:predicted phage tail protein